MNQKSWSILFCALLASTFIHEINAKAADISSRKKRAADPQLECFPVCTDNSSVYAPGNISVTTNFEANIIAIANDTVNAIMVVDLDANIVALLNGTTGAAVVVCMSTEVGVYITSGFYLASNESVADLIASLDLSALLNNGLGDSFVLNTCPPDILDVVNDILTPLIINLSLELKDDRLSGLKISIVLGQKLREILNGSLKGFLKLIGDNTSIAPKRDLVGYVNGLLGLAALDKNLPGGVNPANLTLETRRVQENTEVSNGVEFLVNTVLLMGSTLDLGEAVGNILNDLESLLGVLTLFGGNENTSVNGLIKVLNALVLFSLGHLKLEIVINILLQHLALSAQTQNSLSQTSSQYPGTLLNESLSSLLNAVAHVNQTESLTGLVANVTSFINGNLTINGVNLSNILNTLVTEVNEGVSNLLSTLVSVLKQLSPVVDLEQALATTLLVLIMDLSTSIGAQLLRGVGIVLSISTTDTLRGGLLGRIRGAVSDVPDIISEDLYYALDNFPVTGNVTKALSRAVYSTGLDLRTALNKSPEVQDLTKGFFQYFFGTVLNIDRDIVTEAQELLNAVTDNKFLLNVYPYVKIKL